MTVPSGVPPRLLAAMSLAIASPALAADVETTMHHQGWQEILALRLDASSFLDLADWLRAGGALDGPGSGGPSDLPQDVALLEQAEPGACLSISPGLFEVADPAYAQRLDPLVFDYQLGLLSRGELEAGATFVLLDVLVGAGAPIGSLTVNISNGF